MRAVLTLASFFLMIRDSQSIIDGFAANPFDTLSLASVITRFPGGKTSICGGVLIAPSIVLTAAHCVFINDEFALTAKVTVGDVNLSVQDEREQEFRSHAMAISKVFSKGASEANDDVSVIFLPKRPRVCENAASLQIAQLPSTWSLSFQETPKVLSQFQLENSVCYIVGWGKTENRTANHSEGVRQMMVKLSFRKIGKRKYMIARGIVESSRACMGDSGSPVYCFAEGRRVLVGIVAQIGSFVKMSLQNSADHISFCRDFEFMFVSDWRESAGRVAEILENYGELHQLNEGQKMCYGSGIL